MPGNLRGMMPEAMTMMITTINKNMKLAFINE